jgi:hypothetical protein
MNMFRDLSETEIAEFKKWARDNYKPGDPIEKIWHPVIQAEAEEMNAEVQRKREQDRQKIKEVVQSVDDVSAEFSGAIVLYTSFSGSLARSRALSPAEKEIVFKSTDASFRNKIKGSKPLFGNFPELDELESWRSKARDRFKALGIPFIGDGMTVLNIPLIPKAEDLADEIAVEQQTLVDKVIEVYAERITPEAVDIGPLYRASDYRPVETLRQLFRFTRKWMHFGVPEVLKEIDAARYKAERKRTAQIWAEVKQNGIILLRKSLAEMTERLVEAVTPKDGGEKKRFYGTAVTNLEEFFKTFENRNIADDKELAAQVEKLKKLIGNVDVDQFRTDDKLRATVAKNGVKILESLQTLTVDAEARAITFED